MTKVEPPDISGETPYQDNFIDIIQNELRCLHINCHLKVQPVLRLCHNTNSVHFNKDNKELVTKHLVPKEWILADSRSGINLICNKDLLILSPIHTVLGTMEIMCNAGTVNCNTMGVLEGFGKIWYSKDGLANVLSVYELSKEYRITMDSPINNTFYVQKNNNKTPRFGKNKDLGVYYWNTKVKSEPDPHVCLPLVSKQKKKYSLLDNRRAGVARLIQ